MWSFGHFIQIICMEYFQSLATPLVSKFDIWKKDIDLIWSLQIHSSLAFALCSVKSVLSQVSREKKLNLYITKVFTSIIFLINNWRLITVLFAYYNLYFWQTDWPTAEPWLLKTLKNYHNMKNRSNDLFSQNSLI